MDLFIFVYVLFCFGFGLACGNQMEDSLDKFLIGVLSMVFCPVILGELTYTYLKSNSKPQ